MLEVADLEVEGEVEEEARRAAHDDDGRVAAQLAHGAHRLRDSTLFRGAEVFIFLSLAQQC